MRVKRLLVLGALLALARVAAAQPVPLAKQPPAGEDKAPAARAAALDARVVQLYGAGRAAEALPLAEEALALRRKLYPPGRYPDGHPELAASLNNLGFVLQARGQLARAEPLLREALALARRLYPKERFPEGHPDLARYVSNLALLLQARGNLGGAEPLAREALAMRRGLFPKGRYPAGRPDLANSLGNLGSLLQARGDLAGAEPLLREALAMRRALYPKARFPAGHPDLANSLGNLGFVLQGRGDLAGAEALLREGLAMCRALYPKERFPDGHPDLAAGLTNLAFLLQARGELARAGPLYREALALCRRLYPAARYPAGHPHLARGLSNLGYLLQAQGDPAGAEPFFREALAMTRRLYPRGRFPDGHPELAQNLNNLGAVLQARGDLGGAEPLLREALAMRRALYPKGRFPAGHPHLLEALNNLGGLLLRRGKPAEAEPCFRDALAVARALYPAGDFPGGHPDLARALHNLGFVLLVRGDPARAEPVLREALGMRQRLTEDFLAGAAEAEALNHLAGLPRTRDLYLSATGALPGREADAYGAVWQGKALLARWLGQRRLALRAAADPGTRELARALNETRRELAGLLLGPRAGAAAAGRVRRLAERKEELEKELARRLPAFRPGRRGGEEADELPRRLPAGTAFVDLVRYVRFEYDPARPGLPGERRTACYAAFVLRPGRAVRRVELGPAAPAEAALGAWRRALTAASPEPGADEQPARRVRRLVWDPVAEHLAAGTRAVWLGPDARLAGLPWAALPGGRPGTVLLEECALAVVPHGQVLLEGLRAKRPALAEAANGLLLAVGGVNYGRRPPAEAAGAAAAAGKLLGWPALPATLREVGRVEALAGRRRARVVTGGEASAARLLAELPKARWAHLATHGFFADASFRSALQLDEQDYEKSRRGEKVGVGARNPLVLSGLVLAGANLEGKDAPPDRGILTAEAIAGLDLGGMDLAVLSACDTGLGEVAGGEGVFGLQRAFHVAGCKNVVASLWPVDDEATAALMGLFYHHLWAEKLPPLEALRQAQLTLYRHPERIPVLARARGPDFDRVARRPLAAAAGARAPARLWAGFVLSGLGR